MDRDRTTLAASAAVGLLALAPSCSLLTSLDGLTSDAAATVSPSPPVQDAAPDSGFEEPTCPEPEDPPIRGQSYYLSPTGSDANAGTRESPLETFVAALPKLRAGDELVLADGEYTADTTGLLLADCRSGVRSGTPTDPILVRAEHPRAAWMRSDGSTPAVAVRDCSHWILDGLRASSADVAVAPDTAVDVVRLTNDTFTTLRRSLVAQSNRCAPDKAAVHVYDSTSMLIEDNEVYDYHAEGIRAYGGATLRGNYTSPRGYATRNPPACAASDSASGQVDSGSDVLMENAVAEDNGQGIRAGEGTRVIGSVLLSNNTGVFGQTYWVTLAKGATVRDTLIADNDRGVWSRAWAFTLENVTLYGNRTHSIRTDDNSGNGSPPRNLFVTRSLLTENGVFTLGLVDAWWIEDSNSFGNASDYPIEEPIDDAAGNVRRSRSVSPGMGRRTGECFAYVPPSSPMHGAIDGRADIGASIVHRYVDGALTCRRMWDRTTGRLTTCGATIAGVNDDPDGNTLETHACGNVHKRLRIGVDGCPIP